MRRAYPIAPEQRRHPTVLIHWDLRHVTALYLLRGRAAQTNVQTKAWRRVRATLFYLATPLFRHSLPIPAWIVMHRILPATERAAAWTAAIAARFDRS